MLRELRIRDFAIIDDLSISFRPGLNVITGETGAGKSVILRALGLLCGARSSPDLIRTDSDEAFIEGLFEGTAAARLEEVGLPADEEVLVRRSLSRSGKGRIHVNGSLVTLTLLAQLGDCLVHIYGQHDQTSLLRAESHLDFLDAFGDLRLTRARMSAAHAELSVARERLRMLDRRQQESQQRHDLLEFQVQELTAANVYPGEEEEIRREREVLRHAERLYGTARSGEEALYSGEGAMLDALTRLATQLDELRRIDPALDATFELLENARVQLEETALQLRSYATRVEVDPNRLDEIETRLESLTRLSRKYGVPSNELPATLTALSRELGSEARHAEDRAEAVRAVERLEIEALRIAAQLSRERTKVARGLEKKMGGELSALGMQGARFEVLQESPPEADRPSRLRETGFDVIEFYLAANAGEEAKPLGRVASGGELSRVMLALKALTVSAETPILIFDEVDVGIGGTVADAVARRLKALAKTRQLLCITHLPQIAAYADHHFAVEKQRSRGRTIAQARVLAADERVLELSRMLGGTVAPAEAERYAKKLVAQARDSRATR